MIRWITPRLGTDNYFEALGVPGVSILDVRDLVDKAGNPVDAVRAKIEEGRARLAAGETLVVCCDYGMSRSNAVAAGVLCRTEGLPFFEAVRRVLSATGEKSIKIEVLNAVLKAVEPDRVPRAPEPGKRRVLITGARGFVGRELPAMLAARGHEVIAPDRKTVDILKDAVELDLLVKESGTDTLLHLASPKLFTVNESVGSTLVMLKNVLDVCVQNRVRLVYTSGWEIWSGYAGNEILADERLAMDPKGTYGQAKMLAEILISQYARLLEATPPLVLRGCPVYGPGSDRPRFIVNFLAKALKNEPIVTHHYTNGFPALDLMHVADFRNAIVNALESVDPGPFNLGTGRLTTTWAVAERIKEKTGSSSPIRHIEIDDTIGNIAMNASRARERLGWSPTVRVEDGLDELIHLAMKEKPHA